MNSNIKKIVYGSKKDKIIQYFFLVIWSMLAAWILGNVLYFIIIFPLFIIIFIVSSIIEKREINKFLKKLSSEQLVILNQELEHPLINCNKNYILTENYILCLSYKMGLFKYSEILLMYKDTEFMNDRINEYLIVITKNDWYRFDVSTTILTLNYDLKDFSNIIKDKNPKVLEGNTDENKRKLKMEYDIEL